MTQVGEARFDFTGNLEPLRVAAAQAKQEFQKLARASGSELDKMGKQATRAGKALSLRLTAPLVGVGIAAVKLSSDFETSMSRIEGLVGIPADEVARMSDEVKVLASETGQSARSAAEALFFITSAGQEGATAMETLEASLKASAAGLGEAATVADLATSAMNAYGEDVLSAAMATDVLTAAVREGKLEPAQLAGSMGRVLPIASAMGVEFNEVGAAFAAMSRTGTNANEAATQLRGIMTSLLKPTEQAQAALASLTQGQGSFSDLRAQIGEEGLIPVLQRLTELFEGNDEAQTAVFGNVRALTGVMDLFGKNAETTNEILEELESTTGALDDAFDAAAETTGFKLAQAMSDLQTALIEVGDIMAPVVGDLAGLVTDAAQAFTELNPGVQSAIVGAGALAAALGPLLVTFGALAASGAALGLTLGATGVLGAAVIGFGALAGATITQTRELRREFEEAEQGVTELAESFAAFDRSQLQNTVKGISFAVVEAAQRVEELREELEQAPTGGMGIAQARIQVELEKANTHLERQRRLLDAATSELAQFADATEDAAEAQQDLAEASANAVGGSLSFDQLPRALQELQSVQEDLTEANFLLAIAGTPEERQQVREDIAELTALQDRLRTLIAEAMSEEPLADFASGMRDLQDEVDTFFDAWEPAGDDMEEAFLKALPTAREMEEALEEARQRLQQLRDESESGILDGLTNQLRDFVGGSFDLGNIIETGLGNLLSGGLSSALSGLTGLLGGLFGGGPSPTERALTELADINAANTEAVRENTEALLGQGATGFDPNMLTAGAAILSQQFRPSGFMTEVGVSEVPEEFLEELQALADALGVELQMPLTGIARVVTRLGGDVGVTTDTLNALRDALEESLGVFDGFAGRMDLLNRTLDAQDITDPLERFRAEADEIALILGEAGSPLEDFVDSLSASNIGNALQEILAMVAEDPLGLAAMLEGTGLSIADFVDWLTQTESSLDNLSDAAGDAAEAVRATAEQQAAFDSSLRERILRGAGMGGAADRLALQRSQQREMADAVAQGFSDSSIDLLRQLQQADFRALESQQELDRQTRAIMEAADQQVAQLDAQRRNAQVQLQTAQEQLRVARQQVDQFQRVVEELGRFRDSLRVSELSPLSPLEILNESRRQFDDLLTRARGGDVDAAGRLPQAADTLLDASRDFFASSSGFVQDFTNVERALEEIEKEFAGRLTVEERTLENLERQTQSLQRVGDRIGEQIAATREGAREQVELLREQHEETIRALYELLLAQQEGDDWEAVDAIITKRVPEIIPPREKPTKDSPWVRAITDTFTTEIAVLQQEQARQSALLDRLVGVTREGNEIREGVTRLDSGVDRERLR